MPSYILNQYTPPKDWVCKIQQADLLELRCLPRVYTYGVDTSDLAGVRTKPLSAPPEIQKTDVIYTMTTGKIIRCVPTVEPSEESPRSDKDITSAMLEYLREHTPVKFRGLSAFLDACGVDTDASTLCTAAKILKRNGCITSSKQIAPKDGKRCREYTLIYPNQGVSKNE